MILHLEIAEVHLLLHSFSPQDVALFLQEFNAPDIFMGVFAKSKCPRLTVSMGCQKAALC